MKQDRDIDSTLKMCVVAWGTPLAHYVTECNFDTGKKAHKIESDFHKRYLKKALKKNLKKWCFKTKSFWYFKNKEAFIYFCSNSSVLGRWDFK